MRVSIERDVRLLLASQAVRAFGYGFGSVLLASTLAGRGLSTINVGVVLGALMAGTVIAQLAEPEESTAATAYTNTARYLVRPIGPLLAGVMSTVTGGSPFLIAGLLKSVYDLTLWGWFRTIPLPARKETTP